LWLWLRLTGRAKTLVRKRAALRNRPLHAPAAVLIPAWHEAAVIGDTITHLLASWPHPLMRLYIGCYRNDPATLAAASAAAKGDARLRRAEHQGRLPQPPLTRAGDRRGALGPALCDGGVP
jgi:adsorption protein B